MIAPRPRPFRVGRVVDLDRQPVAILDLLPGRVRLREQHAGIDREDTSTRLGLHEQIDQDRLLLLERAGQEQPRMEPFNGLSDHLCSGAICSSTSRGGAATPAS